MYNPEQKQVILKNSLGVSYHVFFEPGRGLCVRMLGDSGIWSRGYMLSNHAVNDFSVILDREDIFHFAFQSTDGQILYGHGRHGQIEIQPVLTSRDTTPWMKHVSLLRHDDRILLFYMVRYQKKYLLSMQTIKDNSFLKPSAIDYVDGPGNNYRVVIDQRGNCHLFYTSNESAVKRLVHRLYNDSTGIFSAPGKIISTEQDLSLSSVVVSENHIHLLYCLSSENLYQVFCKAMDTEATVCLYKGSSPPGHTGLLYHHGILRYYRVSADCIYTKTSSDSGERWTDEALYPFGTGASLTCFTYFTNLPMERTELFCREIPGNFSKGYQLAFLNDDRTEEFVKDSYPKFSVNSRNKQELGEDFLPGGKAELKEAPGSTADGPLLKELQKKVLLLQNLSENMQRDLTKLWLTQKGHEKKLQRLERYYGQLKNQVLLPDEDSVMPEAGFHVHPVQASEKDFSRPYGGQRDETIPAGSGEENYDGDITDDTEGLSDFDDYENDRELNMDEKGYPIKDTPLF